MSLPLTTPGGPANNMAMRNLSDSAAWNMSMASPPMDMTPNSRVALDPYASKVVLNANLNTPFDSSGNCSISFFESGIVPFSSPKYSRSFQVSPAGSALCGATVTPKSQSLLTMGTGDFTFEAFVLDTTNFATIIDCREAGYNQKYPYFAGGGGVAAFAYDIAATGGTVVSASGVNPNVWTHIAAVRASGVVSIFIAGVLSATGSLAQSLSFGSSAILGGNRFVAPGGGSRISGLRITKGVARYSKNFNPLTVP